MMKRELLGEVSCPSGSLVVVDMGLLGMWSHSDPPVLSEWAAPAETVRIANAANDYRVEGRDAAQASLLFGRTAGWLHDRPESFVAVFDAAVAERGLHARLVRAPRVPHRQRVDHALSRPERAGTVEFHGIWAAGIGALPADVAFPVFGTRLGTGEFSGCWRHVELDVHADRAIRTERIGEVMVDRARLAIADVDGLGAWKHDEPLDGKADFVFWGRDAENIAKAHAAPVLAGGQYGWLDLPVDEAAERGTAVEEARESGLLFATDFRPHSHHYQMMAQVRGAPTESGTLEVGGSKMCAFMTSFGDGIFPVEVDRMASGAIAKVRIVLATDQALRNLRAVNE